MIIESLNTLFSDLRTDGRVMTLRLFEICLRALPQQGSELLKSILPRIFK